MRLRLRFVSLPEAQPLVSAPSMLLLPAARVRAAKSRRRAAQATAKAALAARLLPLVEDVARIPLRLRVTQETVVTTRLVKRPASAGAPFAPHTTTT